MNRMVAAALPALCVVFSCWGVRGEEPEPAMMIGSTSGETVYLLAYDEDPDMRRAVERWQEFLTARNIPVQVFDTSQDGYTLGGTLIAFETREQATLATSTSTDLSRLNTGSPETYLIVAKQWHEQPVVMIVGETAKGTDCGAAWLLSKVACTYDPKSEQWSVTIPPMNQLRRPFFRGREATLCPTGRILKDRAKARKINYELWSEEKLRRYPAFLKACGFNSMQIMELLRYRGGAQREKVASVLHTLADAAHAQGMTVSQYIWGSADDLRWDNPEQRPHREKRYIGLADTYGKHVDHIITHWKDEGYEGGYATPQEATAFLFEQYRKHNPKVRATQDAWFNKEFWTKWEGSKSKTFLDEAYTPREVGIALERWYEPEQARLVHSASRPVGIWGWYLGDFEMNYSSHLFSKTIDEYYSALPDEAGELVDWISFERCFHGLPAQINLYVGGQKMFDPRRDLGEIMLDYCSAVYGPQNAATMAEVYRVVEKGQKEYRYGMVQHDRYPKAHGTPEFTEEARQALAKLEQVRLPKGWQPNFPTVSTPQEDIISLHGSLKANVKSEYPEF